MQMKSRGVGSTQYAYFLSSTLSDPLNAVRGGTQYFWKLLMISCYEPLSACLALFVIRLSGCVCWKPARFLAELKEFVRELTRMCCLCPFLYTVNGNVDKYFLPWSTCFAATVRRAQRHKRANYERDEPGWGAGWGATYFAAFLSIIWRYYFRDVNIWAAFVCMCVCVCSIGVCIQYMEEILQQGGKQPLNACSLLVQTDKCLSYTCSQEVISNIAEQFLQTHFPWLNLLC